MSMTFLQLQNATIKNSFDETDRDDVKTWINARYGLLFDMEEWTFVRATDQVTVTAGSQTVSGVAADFQTAVALQRDTGAPLVAIDEYRDFAANYIGTGNAQQGIPEAFTVLDGTILVGPTSSVASSAYTLVYERKFTELVADGDVPVIPPEAHLGLVFGAKAEGLTLESVVLADPFEQRWQQYVQILQRKYLTEMRGVGKTVPAYRPGYR